ncbi:pseudouridine-5'-phosphate glycosidase [Alphaproteobacteria bacterium]|nr:pseudouridine-5'-phosphate glycosidase [Alphaproteobacteria bacterium]
MHNFNFEITSEIQEALRNSKPIVALESTLISHGLPYPQNIEVAKASIDSVRSSGSIPATIAIIKGKIKIGLNENDMNILGKSENIEKVSKHNLAISLYNKTNAATTVASTIYLASIIGIKFFATGGIGGVHLEAEKTFDISSDLNELSKTNMNIICSGAKSILDLDKTYEKLETLGVPRIGYNTNFMPGFWYYQTDKKVDHNYKTIDNLINYLKIRENINQSGSVLIFNPIPKKFAIQKNLVNTWLVSSLQKAKKNMVKGKELTPFLINEINILSNNNTLKANMKLIVNNALIAGKIAAKYY